MAAKRQRGSPSSPSRITPKKKERFLAVLSETCNVTKSAAAVDMSRIAMYEHKKKDKKFAALWAEAIDEATDTLEEEARRRALTGVSKPVFYQGKQCGIVQEYSDLLTIFLLKAHRPGRFRENVTITDPEGGNPMQVIADAIRGALDK